jgi:hypothetical protein
MIEYENKHAYAKGGQDACCSKSIGWLSLPDMLSLVVPLTFGLALTLVVPRLAIARIPGLHCRNAIMLLPYNKTSVVKRGMTYEHLCRILGV